MDESFSAHYQMHHLNSVITSTYLKGGVSQKYRGVSQKYTSMMYKGMVNLYTVLVTNL